MDHETWKRIPGFSNYEASTAGQIRSLNYKRSGKIKVLKPALDQGYLKTMILGDDGRYHTSRVHRWIALAFLGDPHGLEVNHIDGVKHNNAIENIEYCNRSENLLHAYRLGLEISLKGEQIASSKLTSVQVNEIRAYALKHGKLKNRKQLAEKYGVTEGHLKDIVSRRRGAWNHI